MWFPVTLAGQEKPAQEPGVTANARYAILPEERSSGYTAPAHSFADKSNLALFAGVAAVRALDYASTRHFRALGQNEILLNNSVVDNKPLFLSIEAAGVAAHVAAAYWLHRTGHHRLERWLSIVHIGAGTAGSIRNYNLGPRASLP